MLLKTFLKRLDYQPISVRHDHYDNTDILEFKKIDGQFPYVEFQSEPVNKIQNIYFDVLEWGINPNQSVTEKDLNKAKGFIKLYQLTAQNVLSTLDDINQRLHAFYMLMSNNKT